MNANLPRWIASSLYDYFDTNKGSLLLTRQEDIHTESDVERNQIILREVDPKFKQQGSFVTYELTLNVLVVTVKNENDLYQHDRNIGLTASIMDSIGIFRYGSSSVDDQSQIGCLVRQGDLRIAHFREVYVNSNVLQSTVEGFYKLIY
jgi:hypothetical protein